MWYIQATCSWLTLAGLIWVSGEIRMPPDFVAVGGHCSASSWCAAFA
jgi:hypothetical protein